jgi:hypothetical protein
MLTTKYMQLALMLLALLCFGERGWGSSYHGMTFQDHSGPSADSEKEDSDNLAEKFIQSFSEFEKGVPSPQEMRKVYDDLNELKDKVSDEQFNELVDKVSALQDVYLLLDRADDLGGSKDSTVEQTAKLGKLGEELKGLEEKIPAEVTEAAWKKLQKKTETNLSSMADWALNFGKNLLGGGSSSPVYGPPLPPKDSGDSFFSNNYLLNSRTDQSTFNPVTKEWTIPYKPTLQGQLDSVRNSSSGSSSLSGSGSGASSSSEGSHSSGSGSSSSSFDSIGSEELPSNSSLSTGASLPTGTSSNSRGLSSIPSGTGISQPPISGSTPKPSPLAGGSIASSTAAGGHGGSSQSSSGSSVPASSGSAGSIQPTGTNTQTPLMSRPANAPAPSEIQTEKPKSTEALGKSLSAAKSSPNNLISLSDLKSGNNAAGAQPETGAKPLDNLASAGTVERYQNSPESPKRSYASNDRFITPEKAASSNSAKEISKPSAETSSSSETFVGEQKPSPKATKTPVALGAGASGILSLSEEVAQPSPISIAESETTKKLTKETTEAPVIAKDNLSEQVPKVGTFSGDLAIKPKTTKEVSPIGKGLSEFAKEVEEAELKNQAVEITAAPLKAGLTSAPKITPRGLASGNPQAPAKQSPAAGTFAKVGAQLDDFANRIKSFFSK